MVAYSFQAQFEEPQLSGRKRHTIRAERHGRSRHARRGDEIQHYVGMRTKSCRQFATSRCKDVRRINLYFGDGPSVHIEGKRAVWSQRSLDRFAQADGFKDWREMAAFWLKAHGAAAFSGVIIYWHHFKPTGLK